MTEPKTITIKMRDLVPHKHGVYATFGDDPTPHVVNIALMRWTKDGKRLSALLETHNYLVEDPDAVLDFIVEFKPEQYAMYAAEVANWKLGPPPEPKPTCPTCGHEVG